MHYVSQRRNKIGPRERSLRYIEVSQLLGMTIAVESLDVRFFSRYVHIRSSKMQYKLPICQNFECSD